MELSAKIFVLIVSNFEYLEYQVYSRYSRYSRNKSRIFDQLERKPELPASGQPCT